MGKSGGKDGDADDRGRRVEAHVRDMPEPRESPSLAGRIMQISFGWLYRALLAGCMKLGLRPWHLTTLSLLTNVGAGWLLLRGEWFAAGAAITTAGVFDVLDGGVARLRGEESRAGAFMDSFFDRASDVIVFGCLYWSLSGSGATVEAGLALATLGISLGVSFLRAEGEAQGIALTEGFFTRLERNIALILGLIVPHLLLPALVILVVLGGFTLLQRLWMAIRRLSKAPPPSSGT